MISQQSNRTALKAAKIRGCIQACGMVCLQILLSRNWCGQLSRGTTGPKRKACFSHSVVPDLQYLACRYLHSVFVDSRLASSSALNRPVSSGKLGGFGIKRSSWPDLPGRQVAVHCSKKQQETGFEMTRFQLSWPEFLVQRPARFVLVGTKSTSCLPTNPAANSNKDFCSRQ